MFGEIGSMEESYQFAFASYMVMAAGILSPWRATRYRIDEVTKMVHVWITRHPVPDVEKRRGWFGKGAAQPVAQAPAIKTERHWRHLNCMDYTCEIHTQDELDKHHHDLPWLGQPGLPFSNRLSRQIFACMMEGMEISAICALMNIPFTDLWKFKYALDNGQVNFDYTPSKNTRPAVPESSASAPIAHSSSMANPGSLPDVADPIWGQLLTGDLNIDIKTLSFQLILTKLRQQVKLQQNDEVKLMKLRELHRYVERNQRSLPYELHQLKERSHAEFR
jgi:hypothetical protein